MNVILVLLSTCHVYVYLPQELVQYGVREGGVLPRAELQQLLRVLLRIRLLYQLLEITAGGGHAYGCGC